MSGDCRGSEAADGVLQRLDLLPHQGDIMLEFRQLPVDVVLVPPAGAEFHSQRLGRQPGGPMVALEDLMVWAAHDHRPVAGGQAGDQGVHLPGVSMR